jgi:NtrC-family two-component system sensor histidine kinase KinB
MTIKTKVTYGVVFLFVVSLAIGAIGIFYIQQISKDSRNIIKDNYESLEYMQAVILASDLLITYPDSITIIEKSIRLQEENITEAGELEQTQRLRIAFEKFKKTGQDSTALTDIKQTAFIISTINMQAILAKNAIAQETASRASLYLILITTFVLLIAFTFTLNFPGYIANPIVKLTAGIKSIANKKYEERLTFDRKDEFEELAEAFNLMAEKLDEYEHSNLAKILFEKKRIEIIINMMTDPVVGLDEKNKVVFANNQALNLLNLKSEMLLGRYAPDVALKNDLLRTLLQNGPTQSQVIKIVVDGKENYYSKETIPIQYTATAENEFVSIGQVLLLKNITSYKELDLAKTNFIATISHELKTPIASLQMCIKLLRDDRVGALNLEQQDIAKTLAEETTRLSKITNELLDLAQVESGNIKLTLEKVLPVEILNFAMEAVKFQSERKRVTILTDIEKDLPTIQADMDKTTWVLINLLTNAIRYSPENEKLLVRVFTKNGNVYFEVQDFGIGIESKHLDKLFDKFYQVPGTSSGTGLGLAISKEFIEAQGGEVGVRSEIGKGSTFYFILH